MSNDASNRFGLLIRASMSESVRCFDFFSTLMSAGFSEKKATSAPEINADESRKMMMRSNSKKIPGENGVFRIAPVITSGIEETIPGNSDKSNLQI